MPEFDLFLEWQQDFPLASDGTLLLASGWDQVRQRIIRRILTNPSQTLPAGNKTPADYVFDPAYGIGGGALVSQNPTKSYIDTLRSRVRDGILADAAVDPGYLPSIVIQQPQPNTFVILVQCQLQTGQQGAFSITVG